ncbi:MAG: AbrB/MazE/SpoVT family DNA-binding domain-containing protein [Nanoarchaeota archaeon]|mgnify:CR=1 FL=1
MHRKLIKQGKGGFTIYLPKKWIDQKGLDEKDQVQITETESAIIVEAPSKGKKSFSFELSRQNRPDLWLILTHLHRRGFDEMVIQKVDDKAFPEVKRIVKDLLLGFEVTKDGTTCTLTNLSEPSEDKFDNLLRKNFLIIKETLDVIDESMKLGSFKRMDYIKELKTEMDKFTYFCKRIAVRESTHKSPILSWELLTWLMHIEHAAYYLYLYCSEHKVKIDKNMLDLSQSLKSYFDLYYDLHYKRDFKDLHKLMEQKKYYQFGLCYKALEQSRGREAIVFTHIREIFRLIQIGTSPIISDLLDKHPEE